MHYLLNFSNGGQRQGAAIQRENRWRGGPRNINLIGRESYLKKQPFPHSNTASSYSDRLLVQFLLARADKWLNL
jgi:hypothetical protein